MSIFEAFLLGALQGLTEFLPISSSGHLVIAESLLKLPVENLKSFDIAVHFGTLLAIVVYFWQDIVGLWQAFWSFFSKKEHSPVIHANQKLILQLILASIPAIIFALLLSDWLDLKFRHPLSVAIFMITVAFIFFLAEYIFSKSKTKNISLRQAVIMGFAQCLALIPGVSRSGITISSGLMQGVKRDEAARFSFLLGGVAILGATVFAIIAIIRKKYSLPASGVLLIGISSSFIFGLAAIAFLMRFLKTHKLNIFGYYRIVLGILLLLILR